MRGSSIHQVDHGPEPRWVQGSPCTLRGAGRWVVRTIATVGGVGYLPKAPGTAGSLVGLLVGFIAARPFKDPPQAASILLLALTACFFVGVAVSTQAERHFGARDPSAVVIDEFWGMWAIMVAAPLVSQGPLLAAIAFGLFRAFDIIKPPPLKRLSRLPGGWGIMLDDLGAAAYTFGVLWVVLAMVRQPL